MDIEQYNAKKARTHTRYYRLQGDVHRLAILDFRVPPHLIKPFTGVTVPEYNAGQ